MNELRVSLFGKFSLSVRDQDLTRLCTHKAQELFCYLLLHRDRPQPRETLAGLLWSDAPTAQSKKSLRQTLWLLQSVLDSHTGPAGGRLLQADNEWVQLSSEPWLFLDVAAFEQAFSLVHNVPVHQLAPSAVQTLRDAVRLYEGDLLEGWYQDWCLYERERLEQMRLIMLDKLMAYCESRGEYESGLLYGAQILYYDSAREHTHRQMMRLYYLSGDRTGALRQYGRCVAALNEELGVKPAQSTVALYEQMRADQFDEQRAALVAVDGTPRSENPQLMSLLVHLKALAVALADVHRRVQQQVDEVELSLSHKP
jgi:DNA-binding SARP family transcriptional activator